MKILGIVLLATAIVTPRVSVGCLHFNRDYKNTIKEGRKVVFLFHDGANAHVVLKTNVEVATGRLPSPLAWVIPFPALPTKYREVSETHFKELYDLLRKAQFVPPGAVRGSAYGSANSPSFRLHSKVEVGSYKIQPIEILKPDAGTEFNDWLAKNSFNPMPIELQKYYIKKGAVFLAIQAFPKGREAHLKPLHIQYPASTLSFPIKFTHDTRTFGLDLFVMTSKPLDPLETPPYLSYTANAFLGADDEASSTPQLSKLLSGKAGYVTWFSADGLNGPEKSLKDLKEDPAFTP